MAFALHPPGIAEVRVPGGLRIRVNTREDIGRSICTQGTYDIATSEAIIRLLDGGEVAIDVGANIGWMTSVMARRVGTMGRVLSFEPNPIVLEILKHNLQMWRGDHSLAPITLHAVAVSSRRGSGRMIMPAGFGKNQGLATLEITDGTSSAEVETVTLDEIVGDCPVGLMKVDVEGHEPSVLKGAEWLLLNHRIRDIIYEDHHGHDSPVSEHLRSRGYEIRKISRRFTRPTLVDTQDSSSLGVAPDYLATLDMLRARKRFAVHGWRVLR